MYLQVSFWDNVEYLLLLEKPLQEEKFLLWGNKFKQSWYVSELCLSSQQIYRASH
jgi:hypothetical protein